MIAETGTLLSNRGSAKFAKGRKLGHRVSKGSKCSLGILVTLFFGLVGFTLLGSNYSHVISISGNSLEEGSDETFEWKSGRKPGHMSMMETTRWVSNVIGFGHSTIVSGQDSRYWDRDDRRRDGDYLVDNPHVSNDDSNGTIEGRDILHGKGQFENNEGNSFTLSKETEHFKDPDRHNKSLKQLRVGHNGGNLYNEQNRQELRKYEELYEVDMKRKNGINRNVIVEKISYANADESDGNDLIHKNVDDIDIDSAVAGYSDANLNNVHGGILPLSSDIQIHGSSSASHKLDEKLSENGVDKKNPFQQVKTSNEDVENFFKEDSPSLTSTLPQEVKTTTSKENTNSSRLKHRRRPNLPCEVPFLNSSEGILEPHNNSKFMSFSLQFVGREGKPDAIHAWKPRFAGHQSLYEREKSFYARDQTIHCGFVKGPQDYSSTGFDLSEKDTGYLQKCHIAVSSCIFGNSDNIRTPTRRKMSQNAKKNICFVMFIDEKTLETLFIEGRKPDENGHIGLWKIIVVKNLPYSDMRRVGKVPKFLSHRLFPSARYSIWIDSKMRLDSDPLLILDYFLWQGDFEYAISNHYNRHCVWEEVMQNKRLNKYNHTAIDEQFAFYQADGLAKFNNSDPNKILPSYVPEGSFIVRAHTPMSNLFSCLWFNEVDRFTSRDQLSFAYTFLKLKRMNPGKDFRLNMFKDCERRFMAKIFHHKYEVRLPKSKTI